MECLSEAIDEVLKYTFDDTFFKSVFEILFNINY